MNTDTHEKMIFLIALLAAFPALSTDMYLPALPLLQKNWNQPLVMVNMTLVVFFVAYCVSLLAYGPISDRFGRRLPLMVGIGIYITASLMCAGSTGVEMMIGFRALQAVGAASASALSMAICKDLFDARRRERVIAYIAVIMALAPMMAPVIGGWIMTFFSWPWIFAVQAVLGGIAFVGVWRMAEPLKIFNAGNTRIIEGYVRLFRNHRFISLNLAMAIMALPLFAFIASSSNIYISGFKLSEQAFGYFFAFNAVALMGGALSFARLSHHVASERLITFGFIGILAAGIWLTAGSREGPWCLALPMGAMAFFYGLSRPPGNNLILEQIDRDSGTASSLIVFSFMMLGALAMWIISLNWSDKITAIGVMSLISGGATLSFWLIFKRIFVSGRRNPNT